MDSSYASSKSTQGMPATQGLTEKFIRICVVSTWELQAIDDLICCMSKFFLMIHDASVAECCTSRQWNEDFHRCKIWICKRKKTYNNLGYDEAVSFSCRNLDPLCSPWSEPKILFHQQEYLRWNISRSFLVYATITTVMSYHWIVSANGGEKEIAHCSFCYRCRRRIIENCATKSK